MTEAFLLSQGKWQWPSLHPGSRRCNNFDTICLRMHLSVCLSVCLTGCTQGTLYTTTTVYGVLVHQEGAICTTKAQCAPWCTRETIFFEKFTRPCGSYVAWVRMSVCLSVCLWVFRNPCTQWSPSVCLCLSYVGIWGWALCQRQVAFFILSHAVRAWPLILYLFHHCLVYQTWFRNINEIFYHFIKCNFIIYPVAICLFF